MADGTLMVNGSDLRRLLDVAGCVDAVQAVFADRARGAVAPPSILGVHVGGGGFHVKAAAMRRGGHHYFAAKLNGNFQHNPTRRGLPTIQGLVLLSDADDGRPLAVMDSARLTELRTAAATGVAVRHLAGSTARIATLVGCGAQAESQARAVASTMGLEQLSVHDLDTGRARGFAARMTAALGIPVDAVDDLPSALAGSDVVVTCTPTRRPIVGPAGVRPGALVAAVGADSPEKHEIDPALMAASKVVVDSLEQCAEIGDLHHALAAGVMTEADVHAELGAVVAGLRPGREDDGETIVFDSTGTGLQDVACAALAYERALLDDTGVWIDLAG